MAKKIINKNVFLCHDKRAEIPTKNLVTFKRRDGWGEVNRLKRGV